MCGGLVILASQDRKPVIAQSSYQAGRLAAYLSIGALSGLLGSEVQRAGNWVHITAMAPWFFGVLVALSVLTAATGHAVHRPFSSQLQRFYTRLFPQKRFPLVIGLLSGFLPCGLLYSYAGIAAGTASPVAGLFVMAALWLGGLPALSGWGLVARKLSGRVTKQLPLVQAVVLLFAGIVTLIMHAPQTEVHSSGVHSCHSGSSGTP